MPLLASLAGLVVAVVRLLLALVRHLLPGLPQACAFCASSSTTNKAAYIGTTLFLFVLPFALLSALVYWLIRRAR
ncbi:MAG: hypothetical protein ACM3PF_04555 [Bacteroidota bacterium]